MSQAAWPPGQQVAIPTVRWCQVSPSVGMLLSSLAWAGGRRVVSLALRDRSKPATAGARILHGSGRVMGHATASFLLSPLAAPE